MIQKGMALRFMEDYPAEIVLAKSLGFEFFQVWFYNGALSVNTLAEPREVKIREYGFPIILHAVFDINDFEKYSHRLLELLDFFGHREVILHPVCKTETPDGSTAVRLSKKLGILWPELDKRGVKLYVENNSVLDGFFNTVQELREVFDTNPSIGLLLDLAHINNYAHLREIVAMRRPECIHIADKRFGVAHEHIALGDGDLDFKMIFKEILPDFSGKIILEAVNSLDDVIKSAAVIDRLFFTQGQT